MELLLLCYRPVPPGSSDNFQPTVADFVHQSTRCRRAIESEKPTIYAFRSSLSHVATWSIEDLG